MIGGRSSSSISASQNIVPRAESSMIRPFGADSVAAVGIERGISGSSIIVSPLGAQSSSAAASSVIGEAMRA